MGVCVQLYVTSVDIEHHCFHVATTQAILTKNDYFKDYKDSCESPLHWFQQSMIFQE